MLSSYRLCPNTGRGPIGGGGVGGGGGGGGEEEEEEEEEKRKKGNFYALLLRYANYVIEYLFHLQKYLMRIWEEQTFKF
jgi:hypothetical protein